MTLNSVVKRIKTIALAHGLIKSFGNGLLTDFLTAKTTKYPAVYLQATGGNISTVGHATTLKFRLFIIDLVHVSEEAKENELDAQSDMVSIAMDLVAKMNNNPLYFDWNVSNDNQLKLIAEGENDMVAGCYLDISIKIKFTQNTCQVP